MSTHVFGIRHHGPGCARSLRRALDQLQPDVVVIEAPADVEAALSLAADPSMQPPVALLVYPRDEIRRSVVYPLAVFSPEWQALQWANENGISVKAMDLPLAHTLAPRENSPTEAENAADKPRWRTDPLALLAEAAGHRDPELWWEEQIERRQDASDLFEAILYAMTAIRDSEPEPFERDLLREAFMRKTLRAVKRQGFERIAVVCGAWHAPVLGDDALSGKVSGCRTKDDTARLKGLPKTKTVATWIPWTHSRLTFRSGYGAGVHSPGWYAQLWDAAEEAPSRWIVSAARLLRERDLAASSAGVIEARRLADALAALRELRAPGLTELNEALVSVLGRGESTALQLIRDRLEIGESIGAVPAGTTATPLAEDLTRQQKSLRLKVSTTPKTLDLDLREETGRRRSHLLHQLTILEIPWGEPVAAESDLSTFHEIWELEWQPEFAIALIEANIWGNTVAAAATAKLLDQGKQATTLRELVGQLELALHASLDAAIPELVERIQTTSTVATDVAHLLEAFLPLARVARYGDVRGTSLVSLEPVLLGIFERIVVGLPAAATGIDDATAASLIEGMRGVQEALTRLQRPELFDEWNDRLRRLAQPPFPGRMQGWSVRNLLEQSLLDGEQLARLMRQALSSATPTQEAAAWITGFVGGSGLLLIHQQDFWQVMDHWLVTLPEAQFVETLPILRRAFSSFSPPERRKMGERIRQLQEAGFVKSSPSPQDDSIDWERAARTFPILAQILGVPYEHE